MEDYSKDRLYQKIIILLLREKKLTADELLNGLNELLNNEFGLDSISRRTMDRAKSGLIERGYQIHSRKFNNRNYFVLEAYPENIYLTEEEKLTFPLLLGLLETEKSMNAVEWLKSALMNEFGYSKTDLTPYPYFMNVQPTLNNQERLIILAGKIIDFMKQGKAIQFLYNKNGITEVKQVAPLQIRYYDNRYYMLGSSIDEKTNLPTNLLQTYTLDLFVETEVYPAVEENEDEIVQEKHIYYDYQKLFVATNLEGLLKHSIGIWYDWEINNLKTFKLKFSGWAKGIVKNKKIHSSQTIIEETPDYIIVEITVWDNRETNNYFSRFWDKCERLN
jgi:hypothetical protein